MSKPVYLDYNATTPVAAEVLEAMLPYLAEHFGNPSSSHPYGRKAAQAVRAARASVASALVGAKRHLLVSAVEHPAGLIKHCARLFGGGIGEKLL